MLGQVKNQRFFANETMFGQSPQDRLLVQSDVAHSLILSDGTNRFPETVVDATNTDGCVLVCHSWTSVIKLYFKACILREVLKTNSYRLTVN